MIFLKDAQTLSFERMNRAGEELLGVPRATMLGKSDYVNAEGLRVIHIDCVRTFCCYFPVIPIGRHKICNCMGAACYGRGDARLSG